MKDDDKKKPPAVQPKPRRRYEPPTIESEETFERQAVLGCGKVSGALCSARGGAPNS